MHVFEMLFYKPHFSFVLFLKSLDRPPGPATINESAIIGTKIKRIKLFFPFSSLIVLNRNDKMASLFFKDSASNVKA